MGPEPASPTAICLERAAICCVHGPALALTLPSAITVAEIAISLVERFMFASCRTTVGSTFESKRGGTDGVPWQVLPRARYPLAAIAWVRRAKRLCWNEFRASALLWTVREHAAGVNYAHPEHHSP